MEWNDHRLVIGLKNPQILDDEKRRVVLQHLQRLFDSTEQVGFQAIEETSEQTLIAKEWKQAQEIREQRLADAKEDKAVKEILDLFDGSEIKRCKLMEDE